MLTQNPPKYKNVDRHVCDCITCKLLNLKTTIIQPERKSDKNVGFGSFTQENHK